MGRLIGDAYISILPSSDLFRAQLDAQLKRNMAGLKPSVPITANTTAIDAKIAAIAAALKKLGQDVPIDGDVSAISAKLMKVEAQSLRIKETLQSLDPNGDITGLLNKLNTVEGEAKGIKDYLQNLDPDGNVVPFTARLESIEGIIDDLNKQLRNLDPNGDFIPMTAKLTEVDSMITQMYEKLQDLDPEGDITPYATRLAEVESMAENLRNILHDLDPNGDIIPMLNDLEVLQAKAEEINHTLDNLDPDGDITPMLAKLTEIEATSKVINDTLHNLDPEGNTLSISSKLDELDVEAINLRNTLQNLDPSGNITDMAAKIDSLELQADELYHTLHNLNPDGQFEILTTKLQEFESDALLLRDTLQRLDPNGDVMPMTTKLNDLEGQAKVLREQLQVLDPNGDITPMVAKLGLLQAQADELNHTLDSLKIMLPMTPGAYNVFGTSGLNSNEAMMMDQLTKDTLDAMTAFELAGGAVHDFSRTLSDAGISGQAANAILRALISTNSMWISSGTGGWGILNSQIRLFGGALESFMPNWLADVHLWHLGTDMILEFAAAWGPALIALAAFAAYAYPVGEKIYGQWQNVNVMLDGVDNNLDAASVHLKDLGTSFDQIERAVEPSIMEAFGEYMNIITSNAAPLGAALQKVGNVFDVWMASVDNALPHMEKGFDDMVSIGAKDFAQIGYGFEQLFRIIADLIKDLPGYVHILLDVGDAFLTIAADTVQWLTPVIKIALALHGFIVYVGLATTAVLALGRAMMVGAITKYAETMGLSLTSVGEDAEESTGKFNTFGTALGGFVGMLAGGVTKVVQYVGGLGKMAFSSGAAESATADLGAATDEVATKTGIAAAASKLFGDTLSAIPLGPVGLAATAAAVIIGGALYFGFKQSTDAADKFAAAMKELIVESNVANIGVNLQKAVQQSIAALSALDAAWHKQQATATVNIGNLAQMAHDQGVYSSIVHSSISDADNYGQRMTQLAGVFGSVGAATTALGLAGISAGKVATENNSTWLTTLTELKGLAAGYGYMGQQVGMAGNQLDTLNIASGTVTKNLQTLTQAESAWITLITNGNSAFTTFEQGQQTMMSDLKNGGQTVDLTLGKLTTTFTTVKSALTGTSASSLAAQQAFDAQISAGVTLYGNLQQLATASGNTSAAQKELYKSGKDIIGQLLPMAAGSKEATAEVYALAQVAGYSGADSFQQLAKWVGTTTNSEADLNTEQAKLTISSANLTTAAKNLGNALDTEITSAQAAAIAKTANLTQATQALAKVAENARGQVTQAADTYAGEYVTSLVKAGMSTSQAEQYLNAYLSRLGYSSAAIKEIDSSISESVSAWNNYDNAVQAYSRAVQISTADTHANMVAFEGLYGVLPGTTAQLDDVWAALVKQDTAMVKSGNDASGAKNQFIDFAENGLHLTTSEASTLWDKFGQQDLDVTGAKAEAAKQNFINFAMQGLHISAEQAQTLWGELAMQNLDMLVTKGDGAKNSFISFAKNGLNLTQTAAENLWNTMKKQYLDTLAAKAGETEKAFQNTANQLGVTKTAADKLWTSLHKLAAGSPYQAQIADVLSGKGSIVAQVQNANLAYGMKNAVLGRLQFEGKAAGGVVHGQGPAGKDSVPAMLAPGELVIPASHAASFGDQAKKAGIPGFAAGGIVGQATSTASVINNVVSSSQNASSQFAQAVGQAFANAALTGVGNTASTFSGAVPGGAGNLLLIARYLMANGLSKAAAAGVASVIMGESGGNPEAREAGGGGGWGLIQWTGNTTGLPAGYNAPTGNLEYDMSMQLKGILGYIAARGGIGMLNAAANPILAGNVFSRMEGPAVPLSDTRPSEAVALYAQLAGGSPAGNAVTRTGQKPHSAGGMISEPVYGVGAYSGIPYSFAESGPEQIIPGGAATQGASIMQPMTSFQGQSVVSALGMMVKLLQQMPYAYASALSAAGSSGVRHGYYGAQA